MILETAFCRVKPYLALLDSMFLAQDLLLEVLLLFLGAPPVAARPGRSLQRPSYATHPRANFRSEWPQEKVEIIICAELPGG